MKKISVIVFILFIFISSIRSQEISTTDSSKHQEMFVTDSSKHIDTDSTIIDQFRNNMIDYTGQDLIDASFPNSWPIFGTKIRMAIGGFVKLDYIQDFDGGYDRFQYELATVPVKGDGRPVQSGYMNMFARESRLNIDFRTISDAGTPFRAFIEMDFYNLDRGPFNQTLRLRHFYAVIGRLLFGRTWGTQTDLFAIPSTIDFAAGDALTGTRRALVRFEDRLSDQYSYAVGVEMLEFPDIDGPDSLGQASQLLPLVAARITKKTNSGGRLFLGASVFQLRWDGQDIIPNATTFGWGVSFSGREYFGDNHYFVWMASYGIGWGSNIVANVGTGASAVLTPDGSLEAMPAWNIAAGISVNLKQNVTTNFNINWAGLESSEYRNENKMKSGIASHFNIMWAPINSINTGVEFMMLKRINGDGNSGIGRRLQAMIKFIF